MMTKIIKFLNFLNKLKKYIIKNRYNIEIPIIAINSLMKF